MTEELIRMINKALGLIYDTVHPMPKAEISQILSKIKTELSKKLKPTEFTKECIELIKTPDDEKGWTKLAGYTIWLEVKLQRACEIINQLYVEKPVCPMCGDSNLDMFVDTESFGGPEIFVPIHICKKCDFKWIDDIGAQVWDKNRALFKAQSLEDYTLREDQPGKVEDE